MMRSISRTSSIRLVTATLLVAVALFAALAALPAPSSSGGGVLSRVAPPAAQAFQSGVDGDHAWLKVTSGDIASGAVRGACDAATTDMPYLRPLCGPIADTASNIIGGNSGVWFAIYTDGHYEYGTW